MKKVSLSHRMLVAEGILIRLKRCFAILKDFKELEYNSGIGHIIHINTQIEYIYNYCFAQFRLFNM